MTVILTHSDETKIHTIGQNIKTLPRDNDLVGLNFDIVTEIKKFDFVTRVFFSLGNGLNGKSASLSCAIMSTFSL